MAEHWSWLTGASDGDPSEYTYSPPTRPSRPPHRPLVKLATSAHLHTIARYYSLLAIIKRLRMVLIRFAMIILIVFIVMVTTTELHREVMKTFSYTFGLKMFECGEKANYTQDIIADILDFWKEEHAFQNIETGCLIICAMLKLELLDLDGELLKDHAEGYLRASGADDIMVVYLIDLYTSCRSSALSVANGCKAALKIAQCFRNGIYEQNWIPDISSLLLIPYRRKKC